MQTIIEQFHLVADPTKVEKMEAYMRNQFSFLGIPAPKRKELFREFYREVDRTAIDWNFVFECWAQPQREFQYFALDYLLRLKKCVQMQDIPKIRQLIEDKSWWDTVDGLDALLGILSLKHPEVETLMLEWSIDENFWIRRVAINHQLSLKEQTNGDLLEQILINNFGSTEFFINKAIGWSLRDYSKTNSAWVREFLAKYSDKMVPLSIREASKYL